MLKKNCQVFWITKIKLTVLEQTASWCNQIPPPPSGIGLKFDLIYLVKQKPIAMLILFLWARFVCISPLNCATYFVCNKIKGNQRNCSSSHAQQSKRCQNPFQNFWIEGINHSEGAPNLKILSAYTKGCAPMMKQAYEWLQPSG